MKKIFSVVIVLAAVAMVSCGGNATKPADAVEVEATEVVETVVPDSTACCADSTACEKAAEGEACNK
ncbi:MAG: hypothetical protein RRY33_03930 [Alistipes sp.]